ncbi:MAG TPA: HdeD family acid-resistance protein [Hyphomicrobiaceae bacterium]|nr:HdeD family acid-resistance protein [Hyphomicrobiaceae bacterium]
MATSVNTQAPFQPRVMLHALARNWWLILLRGICAMVFGVLTFIWPGVTLLTLVLFYGAFALADGIFALSAAVTGNTPTPRWWLAIVGLLGIAAGAMTLLWPGLTAVVLQVFIACWAIATGAIQVIGAIQLRKEIENEWLLIAGGLLSIAFGVILVTQPSVGALALLYVIGSYAILYGLLLVWFALRLRNHTHQVRA